MGVPVEKSISHEPLGGQRKEGGRQGRRGTAEEKAASRVAAATKGTAGKHGDDKVQGRDGGGKAAS